MLRRFISTVRDAEKRLSKSYGRDISSQAGRRQAFWHYHLSDHGFLRVLWTNLFEIAPGVWRSNQPSAARVRRYRRMGIKAILNLRGEEPFSFFLFEREAAEAQGLAMTNVRLSARRLASAERMAELFAAFDAMPRPFVMHCKSGADRAGLASALWLMDQEGVHVSVARKQLHWRYAHLKGTSTGILDYLLDAYEADTEQAPMPVRDWFQSRYDRALLTAAYEAGIPAAKAMAPDAAQPHALPDPAAARALPETLAASAQAAEGATERQGGSEAAPSASAADKAGE